MAEKPHSSPAKKPYRTPSLEEVKLVIEEAVLFACRGVDKAGWGGATCYTDDVWCSSQGS